MSLTAVKTGDLVRVAGALAAVVAPCSRRSLLIQWAGSGSLRRVPAGQVERVVARRIG